MKQKPERIHRQLTQAESEQLEQHRQAIEAELPDLNRRDQMRKEAKEEATLSGELRRAVHTSSLSLTKIAEQTGIRVEDLDDFLTGERTLRSDVLDRMAALLGCRISQAV